MVSPVNYPLLRDLRRTPMMAFCEVEIIIGEGIGEVANLSRRPLWGTEGIIAMVAISTSGGGVKNCEPNVDFSVSNRTITFLSDLSGYESVLVLFQYTSYWSSSSSCSSSSCSSSSCSSSSCSSSSNSSSSSSSSSSSCSSSSNSSSSSSSSSSSESLGE